MAAGRANFFRSFMEGLERKPAQPGRGGGKPFLSRGQTYKRPPGSRWGTKPRKAAPSSFRRSDGRLPPEILMKILLYLDASSLFCISHVSKLFHQLANDDVIWQNVYMSEFGCHTWKPWWEDTVAMEARSSSRWKKLYLCMMAGQDMKRWRRELRDISPNTGLPRQTEWVLRNLNVSWELTVCDDWGRQTTLEQSRAYFFESSVIIIWNRGSFPKYQHIRNLQLHGVRKKTQKSPGVKRPGWHSLVLQQDVPARSGNFIGKDSLIKLMHLSPGFVVGVWRGQSSVAFIMASLHFHGLVEKSLLGSLFCPYSEPVDLPPLYDLDPELGLHGYTLHFVLRNTSTEIMSGHFYQLSRHTVPMQCGLMELRVIHRTNMSQHRSLSGNIQLPWKSESLEGSVENCCFIILTLLDEFQKPFWCVSSPICITMMRNKLSLDYSGEHFLMEYKDTEGKVDMKLVWLKEQKQFFLISLIIYVPVWKVNKYFSREYPS